MLKLSSVVRTRNKTTDLDVKRFISHHPYMGMFFCGVVMPILILMTVSALCCAIMFPISIFMGWQ